MDWVEGNAAIISTYLSHPSCRLYNMVRTRQCNTLSGVLRLLALPTLVTSFGTVNEPVVLGQHNEHEMVTRLAFQCPQGQKSDGICFEPLSLSQLAGTHLDIFGVPIPGGGFNGAVGAPDTLDPMPEGPEAHCDDADFIDIPGYPRTRAQANAALQACVDHLRARFRQAWGSTERLLDEKGRVRKAMVDLLSESDCTFSFPSLQINMFGRAKCNALEGLGRALHGVQDFYAHSNWADRSIPAQPISDTNPPGLDRTDGAPFLTNLRASGPIPAVQIPTNLTTGCFAGPLSDETPGVGVCAGRVTHHTITKDHGIINLDGTFGAVGPDTPRADLVQGNFERAVRAAVQGSRDAWAALRDELREQYGAAKGNLMICSLVRDDPTRDCRNRTVSYVLDRSWDAWLHQTDEIARLSALAVNSRLEDDGTDKVAVIHYHDGADLVSSWGDPESAALATLVASQNYHFPAPGLGLKLAIDQIIAENPDTYTDRGAVVLLGAGSESWQTGGMTLTEIQRAANEGIRVHYGCINMPPYPDDPIYLESQWFECWPGDGVVGAVLKTGGAFAYVSARAGRTPADFANLVMDRGLTTLDDVDGPDTTILSPGLTIADFLSPEKAQKFFTYSASAGEYLNFTVRDRVLDGQGTGGCFEMELYIPQDKGIAAFTSCTGTRPEYLVYEALDPVVLEIRAEYIGDGTYNPAKRQDQGAGEIVFTIELLTNKNLNETTTTTTTTSSTTTTTTTTSTTSTTSTASSTSSTISTTTSGSSSTVVSSSSIVVQASSTTTQESSTTQESPSTSPSSSTPSSVPSSSVISSAPSSTPEHTSSALSSSPNSDTSVTSLANSESSTSSSTTSSTSTQPTRRPCNKKRRIANEPEATQLPKLETREEL